MGGLGQRDLPRCAAGPGPPARALDAFWVEVGLAQGGDSRLARVVDDLHVDLSDPAGLEAGARSVVERMALAFQASLLVRFAPTAVADAFCGSRLAGRGAGTFGTLPAGTDLSGIVDRHAPA